jgi:hypothetical protein
LNAGNPATAVPFMLDNFLTGCGIQWSPCGPPGFRASGSLVQRASVATITPGPRPSRSAASRLPRSPYPSRSTNRRTGLSPLAKWGGPSCRGPSPSPSRCSRTAPAARRAAPGRGGRPTRTPSPASQSHRRGSANPTPDLPPHRPAAISPSGRSG